MEVRRRKIVTPACQLEKQSCRQVIFKVGLLASGCYSCRSLSTGELERQRSRERERVSERSYQS